jgi:hypothetical protein
VADVTVTEMTFAEVWAAVLDLAWALIAAASCGPFSSSATRRAAGSFGSKNAVQFAAIVFCVAVCAAGLLAGVLAGAELAGAELAAVVAGAELDELELLLQAASTAHTAPASSAFRSALTAGLRPARACARRA